MAENQELAARIESKIDHTTMGSITVSAKGGMQVQDVKQAMEVAKMMSISGSAVPAHLRNNPGTCLAISIQAWEWAMNPFAVANKSYVVNDRLAYESALYNAVATQRAPIQGRLKIAYTGKGPTRQCTVSAQLKASEGGDVVDYTSPEFAAINPKNSPLWKNDPDQQLFYFSVRAFVRRHFPDVMMGVYTVDELQDEAGKTPMQTVSMPKGQALAAKMGIKQIEATDIPFDAKGISNPRAQETVDMTTGEVMEAATTDQDTPDATAEANGQAQPTDAPGEAETKQEAPLNPLEELAAHLVDNQKGITLAQATTRLTNYCKLIGGVEKLAGPAMYAKVKNDISEGVIRVKVDAKK